MKYDSGDKWAISLVKILVLAEFLRKRYIKREGLKSIQDSEYELILIEFLKKLIDFKLKFLKGEL